MVTRTSITGMSPAFTIPTSTAMSGVIRTNHFYYFAARWYDAGVGRFLGRDPLRQGNAVHRRFSNDVLSAEHCYLYAGNKPTMTTDPWGLFEYYGNWCGPGHPQNPKFNPTAPQPPPQDETDWACFYHDWCYKRNCIEPSIPGWIIGRQNRFSKQYKCDYDLCIRMVASRPSSIGEALARVGIWAAFDCTSKMLTPRL